MLLCLIKVTVLLQSPYILTYLFVQADCILRSGGYMRGGGRTQTENKLGHSYRAVSPHHGVFTVNE